MCVPKSFNVNSNSLGLQPLFFWLSFVFQEFFWEYFCLLLKAGHFFFFFFFLGQLSAVYNLFCLLLFHGHSLASHERVLVKVTWRRTALGWGKKTPVFRLDPSNLFFLGLFSSFCMLEMEAYGGSNFSFFNVDFFSRPPRRRVHYFLSRIWWYGLSFLIYVKSYLFHLGMIRYNHFVEGVFSGKRPLLRAATVRRFRFLERHTSQGFESYEQERFATFLYSGRFILYQDRALGGLWRPWRKPWRAWAMGLAPLPGSPEAVVSPPSELLVLKAAPLEQGLLDSEDYRATVSFFYSYWLREKVLKVLGRLPLLYSHSPYFWKLAFYDYYYFLHCYIQQGPKKYAFATAWIHTWVSLPFIGSLWKGVYRKFMEVFLRRKVVERYLAGLLCSDAFSDHLFLESLWAPLEEEKSFFDVCHSWHHDVRFFEYNREVFYGDSTFFSSFFSNWEITYDLLLSICAVTHLAPMVQLLMGRLFAFSEVIAVLPFSYPFFISWKVSFFYIFNGRDSREEELLFYFKRLHIDAFFLSRLKLFVTSYDILVNTIRFASREVAALGHTSLGVEAQGGSSLRTVTNATRFKLHLLFFFTLRNALFKNFLLSRLLPLYFFNFSLDFPAKSYRPFFSFFQGCDRLRFRSYFAGLFFKRFAAPEEDEPIVFYNPQEHADLRGYYRNFLDGSDNPTVLAMGKARDLHTQTKWFPLTFAWTATRVTVWYMDEPEVDMSNWEHALAGARLPREELSEEYLQEEHEGLLELRLSYFFMVFGK